MSYNKEYHAYTLQGAAKYKNIMSVSFTPLTEMDRDTYFVKKIHSKGDKIIKKFLGVKISERDCEEDEYYISFQHPNYCRNYELNGTISKIKKEMLHDIYSYNNIIWKGMNLYIKAKVCISYTEEMPIYKYFDSNEKAEKYLQEIKEKCEKVGNFLS